MATSQVCCQDACVPRCPGGKFRDPKTCECCEEQQACGTGEGKECCPLGGGVCTKDGCCRPRANDVTTDQPCCLQEPCHTQPCCRGRKEVCCIGADANDPASVYGYCCPGELGKDDPCCAGRCCAPGQRCISCPSGACCVSVDAPTDCATCVPPKPGRR